MTKWEGRDLRKQEGTRILAWSAGSIVISLTEITNTRKEEVVRNQIPFKCTNWKLFVEFASADPGGTRMQRNNNLLASSSENST